MDRRNDNDDTGKMQQTTDSKSKDAETVEAFVADDLFIINDSERESIFQAKLSRDFGAFAARNLWMDRDRPPAVYVSLELCTQITWFRLGRVAILRI